MTRQGSFSLRGIRSALAKSRQLVLWITIVITFQGIGGPEVLYARQAAVQQAAHERAAALLSLGVPFEKLPPPPPSRLAEAGRWMEVELGAALDKATAWAAAAGSWAASWTWRQGAALAAAAKPRPFGNGGMPPPESVDGREHGPSRSVGVRTRAAGTAGLDEASLPLRRVERRARIQEIGALAPSLEHSSAIAPPAAAPRRIAGTSEAAAPEIVALAESLGRSPGRIFRFVHDTIDYEPQWGADAPPLGTLWEGRGTSWEQAWLLQELLVAAGVDARLEWGEIEISPAMLQDLTGVEDLFRAGDLLTTGGIAVVLQVQGGHVVAARLPHVWVKAWLDYAPNRGATPGPGDTWIRMDPTLKRFDEAYGARVDGAVPFVLGPYLQSGTEVTPRATYEQALTAYATDQNLGTLEDLKPRRAVTADAFPFVPGTLRARIVSVAGEAQTVPEGMQQRLTLEFIAADGVSLLTWSAAAPQLWGRRLEIAWPGASASDQATLDLYGGVFATPPYEVDLKPSVRLDGVEAAAGTEVGSAEDVELRATITPPNGVQTFAVWEMFAGEHGVLGLAFGDIPQQVVDRFAQQQATAAPAESEGWGLTRAAAIYLHALAGDYRHLAALRWHRVAILGAAVLAVQRGAVSTASDGTPVTFAEGPLSIDVGAMPLALVPAQGPPVSTVPTLELLGSQGSVREGEALATAFGGEHVTAVGFLTRAVRAGQTLTRVDGTNLDPALAAAELSAEAEGTIRFGVGQGLIAWIPRAQLEIGGWQTTGYILENPASGAGAYLVTFERKVPLGETAVEFHAPVDLAEVTAPTEVIATINADNLQSWSLATRPTGEGATTVIATGTGAVDNAVLGTFDPTLLLNGMHDLVLTGTTAAGKTVTGRISVVVEGGMKIGNFSLSFVDLAVPLSGLAIEIVRTYDSRDKRQGDFGYGWSLDVRQGSYRNNRKPGEGWQILKGFLPCQQASETKTHLTTIRLSDREVYKFRPVLLRTGIQGGGCIATAGFRFEDGPVPGATLEILGPDEVFWANGTNSVVDPDSQEVFEPRSVRLTTRDGRIFDLDLGQGVTRLEDPNGNHLSITSAGIIHSSGQAVAFTRDGSGRITEITDPAGENLIYSYTGDDDLQSVTDREGRIRSHRYSPVHYLAGIIDSSGREILTAQYDGQGRVERTCDAQLNCARLVHDLDNRTEQRIDATDRPQTIRYDERGNVIAVIDALEHETRYEYNERDRVTKQVDPVGAVTIWQYNDKGNLIAFTRPHRSGEDPAAYTTTMTYDARGRRTSVRRPDGSSWTSEYDEDGNLLAVRDGAGNLLEQRGYNARGEVISESDRFGTTEYQDLTESGQPRRTVDPDGSVTTAQYGPIGQVTTMTSPAGTWSFQYNRLGEPTQADYGAGMVVQTEYDEYGSLVAQTSPLTGRTTRRFTESGRLEAWARAGGPEISYQRDAAGRVIGVTDPGGHSVTYGYDAAGRIDRMTDPATGERLLQLDAAGRVTKMTNALGHETSLGYYPDGSVESRRDHLGREWQFRYGPGFSVVVDPLSRTARTEVGPEGEVTRVVYPDDSEDRFEYLAGTPQGEREAFPTRIAPAGGGERLFTYDALGRLASATDLAGAVWTYQTTTLGDKTTISAPGGALVREDSFNAAGELAARRFGDGGIYELDYDLGTDPARIVKPSGVAVALEYNPSGQLVSRTSTSGETESFTWTGDGSLAGFVDATGTTTYGLDAAGRLASLTQADGSRVVYGYDVLGRVTSVTVQAPGASTGSTTTYRYDEVGNLTEVDDPVAGVTSFAYDRANRLTGRTLPNGVTSAWGYDLRDRILSVEHHGADGSVLASFVYTRGARGEISRVTREDASRIEYGYDAALRLTSESRRDSAGTVLAEILYTYDAAGNRLTETKGGVTRESSYLSAFRLSQVKVGETVEQSYSWDADGRVAAMSREGMAWTLGYDTKDALRSVSDGTRTLRYDHDAQGRRVAASDGSTTRQFLVAPVLGSGLDSVHLATGDGATSTFLWAGPQPLARIDGSAVRYFLTDGIGSVIGLVDSAGQVTARREFDAFGNLHSASGEPAPAHLGGDLAFQGEWREELTGLYHMRSRDYDPVTGRFLSRDPAEVEPLEPESLHPYTFAYGNPLLYSDPTGMFTMVEINVTMTIDNIISAIKTAALNKIRQEVIEEVQEAAVNFLLQMIGSWVGFDLSMFAETAGSPLWQIGREFEELAHESLCTILPRGVYFEAGIDQSTGKAQDDGWTCPTSNRHGFAGVKGIRRPDFLINQGSPMRGSKSLLIGEIKLGIGSFYRAWKGKQKGQWKAIHNHSKQHAWFPHAVVLFAFKGGTAVQRKWLESLLVENGHLPVIIVILGD